MPAKLSEKPVELKSEASDRVEAVAENSTSIPVFATGYDVNGEAIDVPVDTRPADVQTGLPGVEDDQPVEMFEGKRVIGHKFSFTGNYEVSSRNAALMAKLDEFARGQATLLLVQVEPGSVTFAESTEDGHVRGVFHKRKLHITGVFAADNTDTDELFEGGAIRTRRLGDDEDDEDDGIGYLTAQPGEVLPEVPESMYAPDAKPLDGSYADEGDLAASLMAAGLCGKRHRGHANTCRLAAHVCELPEAGEDE